MIQQLKYFLIDYHKLSGKQQWRKLYIWMNRASIGILTYRLDRGMYLSIGKLWQFIRVLFLPILNLIQAYSNCDIHYQSDIKGGLSILHSSLGVVISGKAIIGKDVTFTGGNVIGLKDSSRTELIIGDNCTLGANAVILAPVTLGNNVRIGACALVISSFPDGQTLVGIPAKSI